MFQFNGQIVDLFCGAGGLSLGFHWAKWEGLVSNDIDRGSIETHAKNIGTPSVHGSITDEIIFEEIIDIARQKANPYAPCIVLGGPPCQGFSTAGNARSMKDVRNHLFKSYARVLCALQPEHFIFENVPGLLSMDGGIVLADIKQSLADAGYSINMWRLNAENYGVPQRRQRILLIGTRIAGRELQQLNPITCFKSSHDLLSSLPRICGVQDALDDLPIVQAGEDASGQPYRTEATNLYQQFVRELVTPDEYIARISTDDAG
jgi:DNA (cytosine-5)-methyltransferase 1